MGNATGKDGLFFFVATLPKLRAEQLCVTRNPHLYKHKLIRYVLETFLITPVTVNHMSYTLFLPHSLFSCVYVYAFNLWA